MKWFDTSNELPPLGIFVLGYYNGGNYDCISDPIGCNMEVVRLLRNQSGMDENLYWDTFGPTSYNFQYIKNWLPLPNKPEDE